MLLALNNLGLIFNPDTYFHHAQHGYDHQKTLS